MEQSVHLEVILRFEVDKPFTKKDVKRLTNTMWDALWSQANTTAEGLCPCDGYTTRIKIMHEGKEV